MDPSWATDHLQVIRTLMERSALYRRALAPIMIYNGLLGAAAAAAGLSLRLVAPNSFVLFWTAVAGVGLTGSFLLVRKQAIKDREPFWSSPTRRVTQALLPPVVAGLLLALSVLWKVNGAGEQTPATLATVWLPLSWVILYGCAFHAAGFFMPRGMRLFAWLLILGGCTAFVYTLGQAAHPVGLGHLIMGVFFGATHLAYGIYLFFTEPRRNEA